MDVLIFGPADEFQQVLALLPAVERTGPTDPEPRVTHLSGQPTAVAGDLIIITQPCPTWLADEARVWLRPGGVILDLRGTSQQDRAERFTRAQSCHGDPDACGCGGSCPVAGGVAA